MTRIILSGACGAMGQVIANQAATRDDCVIVAGIDPTAGPANGFPVFASAEGCDVEADVILDFSHPSALPGLFALAKVKRLPLVVATTGFSQAQIDAIHRAAQELSIFFTFNMSLGVNLMTELAKRAAKVLGGQFDVEIVEKHHNRKIDAPSGTALMLADAVAGALPYRPQYIYDRHAERKRREKTEIGIHAVRGGTIAGEHEVIFAGQGEVLTLHHSALSKDVFATGALSAACFMKGKPAGLYDMKSLLDV